MAKNNQNDPLETIFSYIIVFLIVVVALVAGSVLIAYVAAPLIFLILYLINQIAYLASDRKRKRNFFWLTYDERELFKSRWEDFVAALKMKEYVEVAVEREALEPVLSQNITQLQIPINNQLITIIIKSKYYRISLAISIFGCIFGCRISNTPSHEHQTKHHFCT